MTTISVKIPEKLKLRMESESSRRGVSKSRLIREALERAFGKKTMEGGPTVFDLTKDLCGAVTGGPADLSSAKEHLEGYGE
jgi:predicted DNA-binding protein